MKAEHNVLLSGLGYYRLSKERRRILGILAISSLAVHLLALAIFGSWVVLTHIRDERTVFTAPPPLRTYQPREIEHQVKVQQRQRSSSRPQITPRMVSARPSSLSLPEIRVDPKVIRTTFQPQFRAVTGAGLGAGLGTGFGLGGFGPGVSQFDFFGIRGRGNRIAILVDVSGSMIEDERGGIEGFQRVKNRIYEVIDALSDNALFNVIAFADAAQTFREEMVIASEQNRSDAKAFLQPFNTSYQHAGLSRGNVPTLDMGVGASGGSTRTDLALNAAFMQAADTILLISDGIPLVRKVLTDEERASWESRMDQWRQENAAAMEAHRAHAASSGGGGSSQGEIVGYRTERVRVPARPYREGGPPPREASWETRQVPVRRGGHTGTTRPGPPRPTPPGMPFGMRWWTLPDFQQHIAGLTEEYHTSKGRAPPVLHTIGYRICRDGNDFLRALSSANRGNHRRVGAFASYSDADRAR